MVKRHTEDYKLSAVKYALRTDNMVETCDVFECKRPSLHRWIQTYKNTGSVVRKPGTRRTSYKITQSHLDFLRAELKKKPEIFMEDLKHMLEKKFPELSVSREHIAKVLRDNNKTRKRLRKIHQPATYRGKTRDHKKEVKDYIEEARKHDMDKIICLDETAIYAALKPSYARCNSGKRCYVKTTDSQVHKHYSLLVAISNKKTIGWTLYEKGAVNAERLVEFIRKFINGHYTGYTVVMDNAMFHKSNTVKDAVKEGGNEVLYSVPYYPRSNPIEQFFSQMKHYIKKESPILFDDIKRVVVSSIEKVKPKNYENYFLHAFRAEWLKKTRRQKMKPTKEYKFDT